MNVDLGIWDKLTKAILFLLVLAALLGVVLWYLPLIKMNEDFRRRIATTQSELSRADEQQRQLRAMLESFKDPVVIERLARERLAYSRPGGEKIIQFVNPPAK
jgi:cell division protein FtsB